MRLDGYKISSVKPAPAASGPTHSAIITTTNTSTGIATANITFASDTYDIAVNYYDIMGGRASYELAIDGRTIGTWRGDLEDKLGHAFSTNLDGHSATRITFPGVAVNKGSVVKITGRGNGNEAAPVDYVSFLPVGVVD